jgi:hypothetical protein
VPGWLSRSDYRAFRIVSAAAGIMARGCCSEEIKIAAIFGDEGVKAYDVRDLLYRYRDGA